MNAKIAASLVLAAAAGGAWAETPGVAEPFNPTRSRAEVQAEFDTYRQARVNPWSTTHNHLRGFKSSTSRDAVVAEYVQSREEVAARNGEDSGSAWLARNRSTEQTLRTDTLAGQPSATGVR